METKAMLSWLHIADLQMGSKGSDSDALLKDVESQLQATGVRPDFVAVTGDVARSGQWKHYQLAAEFFDSLLKRIDAAKDRLFIVPGNHDIDKRQVALGKGSGDDPKTSIIAPDRFVLDNYARFIDEYLGESMRLDASRYAYLRRLDWGGRKVAVAGLNTAAVGPPLHPSAPKDLISDFEDQARSVLDQMGEDDVSIALLHHSLDSLPHQRGYGSIHAWLQRCDFVLCAHTHSGDVLRVIQSNGRALTIQGGSDPSFSQHPNAYNFVELDPGRGVCRVHFRQYDPGRRAWQEDFRAHPKAVDGIYTFQLPERLRTHPKSEPKEGYSPPLAGYTPDIVTGDDKLGIMSEVEAFSSVIAYKGLRPPLCLGVFGDWGSGKTFFMKKMSEQVSRLAEAARDAEDQETDYCCHIVQIDFNAWHYVDANLWACLINHIFEGLHRFTKKQTKEGKEKRALDELKLAKEALEKAERRKEAAEKHVQTIESKLREAREGQEQASLALRDLLARLSLDSILTSEEKKQLQEAAEKLGLAQAYQSVEELDAALRGTRGVLERFRIALFAPHNRKWGFALLLIVLVGFPLVGIIVNHVLGRIEGFPGLANTITTVAAQIVTLVGSVIAGLNFLKSRTDAILGKLEGIQDEARKQLRKKQKKVSEEEARLRAKLEVFQKQHAAASQALAKAQARVEEAEIALEELKAVPGGKKLAELISERVAGEEYRRHLGVISTIREDLEFLSCKLNPSEECREKGIYPDPKHDESLPRVDRIVLYIDDLDRCPEERVVEVLQAVHLLLAFELFVVVVGVDSRWLLRSLEESYSTLQMNEKARAGWSEEEVWAWQSTPQNYLEKIFQIPYNLRPMNQDGFRELVGSTIPPMAPRPSAVPSAASLSTEMGTEESASPGLEEASEGEPEGARPTEEAVSVDDVDSRPTETPHEPAAEPSIDLTPSVLRIEEVERAFISQLSALIPTPRAAKRFINIYRLIRATVPPEDLSSFVGNPDNPGEHRAVMILLSILTGFSRQAPYVFRKVLSSPQHSSWHNLVDAFDPQERRDVETVEYYNGVVPKMSTAEAVQWERLHTVLAELGQATVIPKTVAPYIRWAPQVARFSFRVGKITGGIDLTADIRITHIELDPSSFDVAGEYVLIENNGDSVQSMKGWRLSDEVGHTFEFPEFGLPAGDTVKVWVGKGRDTPTDLHWDRKAPVWNNVGDTAELRDDRGILISTFTATPEA